MADQQMGYVHPGYGQHPTSGEAASYYAGQQAMPQQAQQAQYPPQPVHYPPHTPDHGHYAVPPNTAAFPPPQFHASPGRDMTAAVTAAATSLAGLVPGHEKKDDKKDKDKDKDKKHKDEKKHKEKDGKHKDKDDKHKHKHKDGKKHKHKDSSGSDSHSHSD